MSNQLQAFKALITYAVIVPMAIFVGYMLADPLRYSTFGAVGVVLGVMIFPLLLKWHQPLLLFSWNMSVVIPFIKGQPYLWLVMSAATLGIAILERALNRDMRFVQVWSLSLPLIFFVGVILFTAKMTGGIGLRTFGSEVYGGRKYIFLLGAIAAYFALTAWRVPPHRAKLYVGLFFLGALTHFVGDLVQAARRSFLGLDERFFQRSSVAVYPVDPVEPPAPAEVMQYRRDLGVQDDEVLFGRFSRPEPNKWTDLALRAFRIALRQNPKIKLLFRESPPAVSEALRNAPDADRYIILPATADPAELRKTMAGIDVVLHTSSIGESFGYGIAEAMALGKPVITHSVPWGDQAQIELARHGECGFVASTPRSMARCILELAGDKSRRIQMGTLSRNHIQQLSDPETSTSRIHRVLEAVIAGRTNPFLVEDLEKARETARYLDRHQFGNSASEQIALRPMYYWAVFHRWRKRNARAKQSD